MYRYLPHTADFRLEARDKNLKGVFVEAAKGMLSIIYNLNKVEEKECFERELNVEGDLGDTLFSFLNEILFIFSGEEFAIKNIKIYNLKKEKRGWYIRFKYCGEKFNFEKHEPQNEIKAVTYNDLIIKRDKYEWVAQVTFDV